MFELQERADLIKKERKKQSLSQQQLADKVGCSLRTIQRLEKGDDISDKYLRKIAEVIGLNDNQLLVDQKGNRDKISNMIRMTRIRKGNEVYSLLNNYNMKIKYDYSPHFKQEEEMNLAIKFFSMCAKYHKALFGEVELSGDKLYRPSPSKVNFDFAPILAKCNGLNVGIFGKMFCSVSRGRMTIKELEKSFLDSNEKRAHYYPYLNKNGTNEIVLFLYATPYQKAKYDERNPLLIDVQQIQLPEVYVKSHMDWHFDDLYVNEESDFSLPEIVGKMSISEALGIKAYLENKRKEDPDYTSEFWRNNATLHIRDQLYHAIDEILYDYDTSDPDNGKWTRTEKKLNKKDIDKRSYEDGEKVAAEVWNAWDILNKRAQNNGNKWIDFEMKQNSDFPDISRKDWYGLENTEVKTYKYKKYDTADLKDKKLLPDQIAGAYYVSNDGEELPVIRSVVKDQELGDYDIITVNGQEINSNQDKINFYQMKKEFKKKVEFSQRKLKVISLLEIINL